MAKSCLQCIARIKSERQAHESFVNNNIIFAQCVFTFGSTWIKISEIFQN